MKLTANTILVTGGATGIGLALAKRLSESNQVIICGRNEAALQKATDEVPALVTLMSGVAPEPCSVMVELFAVPVALPIARFW